MRFPRSHGSSTLVAGLVAAALALTGCLDDQTVGTQTEANVPPPAVDVSGDPAAISGAGDTSTAAGAAGIATVVMIGDSITKGSTSRLKERFDLLGLDNLIAAENGKRMAVSAQDNPSGAEVASFLAQNSDGDHSDEVWVVALGTNDVSQYSGPDSIAASVNEVLNEVPDDAAVVWVDIYFRDRPEDAASVNSIIRERVTRRGDSVIAPWAAFAASDGVLTGDGVHPTSEGSDVFAFVVTDTVRAFLGR